MAQRMGSLAEWSLLEADQAVSFPGRERLVCLEVNSPGESALWARMDGEPDERFVALVRGRDRVEFTVPGDFDLFATGGECWYKTVDGSVVVNIDVAPVIFTRIANRKVRNRNLEWMEFQMMRNVEQRMEQLENEAQQRLLDTERRYVASRRPHAGLALPALGEPSGEGPKGQGTELSQAPAGKSRKDEAESGAGGKAAKGGKSPPEAADD